MADRRSHDPFAPAARRPFVSTAETTLPEWARDLLSGAGASPEEVDAIDARFGQADRRTRGTVLRGLRGAETWEVEHLVEQVRAARAGGQEEAPASEQEDADDEDERDTSTSDLAAVWAWHDHMVDAGDDEATMGAAFEALHEVAAWLDEQEDPVAAWEELAALIGDGPHRVAVYDAAVAEGMDFEAAMALAYGEVEEPAGDDEDPVPSSAPAIVEWIDNPERAQRALDAEVARRPRQRRTTVLTAASQHLGEQAVEDALTAADGG